MDFQNCVVLWKDFNMMLDFFDLDFSNDKWTSWNWWSWIFFFLEKIEGKWESCTCI